MVKATVTIRQTINTESRVQVYFAANQALFNRVASFYFDVIQAHIKILDLSNKEALTALEKLTHTTELNPHPVMPLTHVQEDLPAMFRRAAINAALGSAHSFYGHLARWHKRKEKVEAKGKKFRERPPVPPRTWNRSVTLYAGLWKERMGSSILIKVWTGTCWSWIRVRITGRELPEGWSPCSPQLVQRGGRWYLHTPIEKKIKNPVKIEKQIKTNEQTRICAIDLNINEHVAVCTIRDVEGSTLATLFIGGGQRVSGFRKQQLGRIARNRSKTGMIAEGEQDNADLWKKIRDVDDHVAHLVSRRIVQFAQEHEASILVFEHLGSLRPEKGKYSKRGNSKRAFWMKGRIFNYAKYKAYNAGILTSRVSPKNTSCTCARCGAPVARYCEGQEPKGYTMGAPLVYCEKCGMKGNADRNASLMIGNRLFARFGIFSQEKPQTSTCAREEQSSGVTSLQEPNTQAVGHSSQRVGHESRNGHGTAQDSHSRMVEPVRDITDPLRPQSGRSYAPMSRGSDYVGVSEAAGRLAHAECHQLSKIPIILQISLNYEFHTLWQGNDSTNSYIIESLQ
jgi:putative transposase